MSKYSTILVSAANRVGIITLDRPEALNALNEQLLEEVVSATADFDADPGIGAILLTGSEKAFAAGADIKQMSEKDYPEMYATDYFRRWDDFARLRTPVVAAVNGYALGGGCELAMMADLIIAGQSARFGQPEINLGVIPGMGGSQRLTRSVGKAKAMDMVLTGRHIDAAEAERIGLVSRVVPDDQTMTEATEAAELIASKSKPAAQMAKEAVASAFETTLQQGLLFERRLFHSRFSMADQAEGMNAFAEKRAPSWTHR